MKTEFHLFWGALYQFAVLLSPSTQTVVCSYPPPDLPPRPLEPLTPFSLFTFHVVPPLAGLKPALFPFIIPVVAFSSPAQVPGQSVSATPLKHRKHAAHREVPEGLVLYIFWRLSQ
jgi:hypothetical protein